MGEPRAAVRQSYCLSVKRRLRLTIAAVVVSICLASSRATFGQAPHPRVVVLLFEGLSARDLADPTLPNLHALALSGQTALMNTAVTSPRTDAAAVLTLALGALTPSEPTDADIYQIGEPVERTTAANVYRRRIGPIPLARLACGVASAAPLVHIGWAPILRRQLDTRFIGSVLQRAGQQGFLAIRLGGSPADSGREIGLLGVGSDGIASCGELAPAAKDDPDRLLQLFDGCDDNLAVLLAARDGETHPASLQRLEAVLGRLAQRDIFHTTRFMLVSPHPPPAKDGSWDRLSIAVLAGPGMQPGIVSSPTTRTPGLIANIDIAPTLLSWVGVRQPAEMAGHVISKLPAGPPSLERLRAMDTAVHTNGRALTPVFVLLGVMAAFVVALGFWKRSRGKSTDRAGGAVLIFMSFPLAMLLAAPMEFSSAAGLCSMVVTLMGLIGQVASRASRRRQPDFPERAPLLVAAATVAVLMIDAATGQRLVKFSLFSSYQLQGIRFYGIGNEYMGVMIGFTLLAAFVTQMRPARAALLFAAVAFTIGWPALGANAGGLIAAVVAFLAGWRKLTGKPVRVGTFAAGSAAGLAAAFAVALLDRTLSGGAASHMGGTISAAGEQGWGYLVQIASRKAAMNLRIMMHPAVIAAAVAVAAILVAGNRRGEHAWTTLAKEHPLWYAGLAPAGWGALAAFLFNDSGTVAALFLVGAFLATGVYLLFADPVERPLQTVESGKLSGDL